MQLDVGPPNPIRHRGPRARGHRNRARLASYQLETRESDMRQSSKFGIYLNASDKKVVRLNSPYWLPEEPDWVFLTPEVNATLLRIRDLAKEKNPAAESGDITWGMIPLKD